MKRLLGFAVFCGFGLLGSDARAQVVISQIYGGGGNTGAPYANDFVEVFNPGGLPVDVSGWSLQYASASGTTFSVIPLPAASLGPGQYFLIQGGTGGLGGAPLPPPDATTSINLAATAGKLALVRHTMALSGACPTGLAIADFVGYGMASCAEGSGPAPSPSNVNAVKRARGGCTDTNDNASDFSVATPAPRNGSSPPHSCATCGDGVIDPGEQCDDGLENGATASCCNPTCMLVAPGTACDDEQPCTRPDQCDASGVCAGKPVPCTTSDPCRQTTGMCQAATGACSFPPKPNGTPCDDGNACTVEDACQAGSCQPGTPTLDSPAANVPQTVECVAQTIESLLP